MGYEMKTRSAVAKSLSFWLQWDRGPLGLCCVCLHMNKPGGALFVWQSGLQSKAGSLDNGLRWDGCRSLCPGCVEKGFQRWLQIGGTFCALRTWSLRAALGAVFSRASRLCLYALQSWRNLSYYLLCECQEQPHVPMTGTGARHGTGQFSSGRITQTVSWQSQDRNGSLSGKCQWCRLSLLGTCACGSGDTQHPVWGPDSDAGMAGRGERVTTGEMQWWEGEWLNLKHLGSPGHRLQLVLAKGCQGFCSPAFGRAVVSSLPSTDHRGL